MKQNQNAETIRRNAKNVLQKIAIENMAADFGELFFTGSYLLDLMTWNDIDMQLTLNKNVSETDALLAIHEKIVRNPAFIKASMINFSGDYKPKMPRGLYLGANLEFPKEGGLWKLDLWILSAKDFDSNRQLVEKLQKKITPVNRALILEIKQELMETTGRVPQMGSHFLYQAILQEGLKDRNAIFDYMRNCGVKL